MAEESATFEQQAVIDNRGGTMLVSAAAGSGKTWVLVQRLMKQICGPDSAETGKDVSEHPSEHSPAPGLADINDFLIITYTKAAAEELRIKISKELSKRLAADPTNRHLQRQMNLIYMTQISTVHAFCSSILHEYAHKLSLPPDFRVADEELCRPLQNRAMEDTLESAYAQIDQLPGLADLVDLISSMRNDKKLEEVILTVYKAVQSHPWPKKWITECRAALQTDSVADAGETSWGSYLLEQVQKTAAIWLQRIEQDIASMQDNEKLTMNYVPAFLEMKTQLLFLREKNSWDAVHGLVRSNLANCQAKDKSKADFYTGKLGTRGKKDTEEAAIRKKEKMKAEREACQKAMSKVLSPFRSDSQAVLSDLHAASQPLQVLLTLTERFTEAYQAAKQRQRYADYNDLEHEAINLLTTKTGSPSEIAREISSRYTEIMVDEFQDSNAVQETIFAAISKKDTNRFLVGDVRQSIYKFRLADPGIFLEKYRTYSFAADAARGKPRKLLLTRNFRSDPQILDAVNFVFRSVMSEAVGDLTYGEAESLYAPDGKQTVLITADRNLEPAVELHVIDMGDLKDAEENSDEAGQGRAPGKKELEAAFVADHIRKMADRKAIIYDGTETRPMRYGDVVILMRAPGSSAGPYIKALESAGIPVYCDRGGSVFDTPEAATLTSLLQIIDNPRRDVPLICVLQSPIGGFTSDELAAIRLLKHSGDYWEALQLYAAGSEKTQHFLAMLNSLRNSAPADTVTRLLDQIWQETDISAIYGAMDGGEQRVRNLEALYNLSLNFDGTLMDFLERLEGAREEGLAPPPPDAADNCVTIMTIHKSKGLEFPVVFLSDLFHGFNTSDSRQAVLVHAKYGLGSSVLDRQTLVRYPTIARNTIQAVQNRETLSEEMRVLYVAMTRPQSRLIMTMCGNVSKKISRYAADAALPMPETLTAAASSPGDWILMAALCRMEAGQLHAVARPAELVADRFPWKIQLHAAADISNPAAESKMADRPTSSAVQLPDSGGMLSAMQYVYPHRTDTRIPSKVTATQLKGRTLDQETAEGAESQHPVEIHLTRPRFRHGPVPLTAAQKGTATHLVMQFAEFSRCTSLSGVQEELNRLVEMEFITEQQKEAVHPEQIAAFFSSATGQELLQAHEVVREFKFSILVPASDYYAGGEGQILLQGVVDCCIVEHDSLTILDFKTDHVTEDTISDRAAYYRGQMDAYTAALEKIFDRPVKKRILYFFHAYRAISI